ncbi:SDR family NAD(P)-dependent oxidoreductase [Cryobacterium sp. TMT1-21]|uniref:SDR family NAD(P)-dependent oxidoreductase n=1 Tax=Cryobacterium shii TaxID=1259235 RepID=A0AAQ2HGL1_9MICO|nr:MULTISPECIES: SDR family NAD(P)-dependent oxidoreductase [Cryobacterium]TFC50719.1 SDR family NAD(P)-dependent oxidoreductase [Cryobacterium shii]TFC82806.1 SDR family NAD(P)-dependent oxidoreductase [Cryobacterium sp. TmT2-59]TFD10644.1 SDR family NAD(P)-dependent oxidoreductase [Cryobacterium sp. TMT1-21]TFD12534.1 SDR family NAD(P)-dependent oxidoreductase [Cryobacterium sp. TMT4-10]TFD16684.1 SDR family NAD(P)-dependent oxidoreductase [Cryobacterium sp. TMT2-23]
MGATERPAPDAGRSVDAASRAAAGRTVLIAGATSAAGRAVASALTDAGARVIAVGSNAERLQTMQSDLPGLLTYRCDLADFAAVTALADAVRADAGPIDGLIHLVGGWRGGGGLVGQTDADWDFLHAHVVTTLRNTTRAFNDDLLASPAGRLAIVSSVSVDKPAPGGANYAAAKAAAETWTRAVGQGFAKAGTDAAAVIFVVRALDGLEGRLAAAVAGLWDVPAASVNNTRVLLAPPAA